MVTYTNEYRQICAGVLQYRYLETGDNLFGPWKDDHTAVIQLVLGPGENCQRASASFYQDADYQEKAGSQLIKNERGLSHCRVGFPSQNWSHSDRVAAIKE